jgi:hypothetical protein
MQPSSIMPVITRTGSGTDRRHSTLGKMVQGWLFYNDKTKGISEPDKKEFEAEFSTQQDTSSEFRVSLVE